MNGNKQLLLTLNIDDESQTHAIAASLARQARPGDCFALQGDLGAGKTSFARGLIKAIYSGSDAIVSPTFTLVQTYPADNGALIWHFDLYRLESAAELEEIGLDDALREGISIIEWPQLAQNLLPATCLAISISENEKGGRTILFNAHPDAWASRIEILKEFLV